MHLHIIRANIDAYSFARTTMCGQPKDGRMIASDVDLMCPAMEMLEDETAREQSDALTLRVETPCTLTTTLIVKIRSSLPKGPDRSICLEAARSVRRSFGRRAHEECSGESLSDLIYEINGQLASHLRLIAPERYGRLRFHDSLFVE